MPAMKRAADIEGRRQSKHATDDRALKKARKNDSSLQKLKSNNAVKSDVLSSTQDKHSHASILKVEERSFPRGGAGVLSPLERKQIQIEATNDVLFEQSGNKRLAKDAESADELDVDGAANAPVKNSNKKRKNNAPKTITVESGSRSKIEGLSFRRLLPGSLVLGRITQITSRDIALALPNNLVGYVPLMAVSDQVSGRVEKLLAGEEDSDEEPEESDEDINLHKMFTIGQYLRAYVQSAVDESSTAVANKVKRRIELSINPRVANTGVKKKDIVVNSMIQASVISVEDHGLIMDLGLEDASIKGFMSSKELGHDVDHAKVESGTVFLCLVVGSTSDNKIVKLSADHRKAGDIRKKNFLVDAPNVDMFLPGTAVEMLVTDVTATDLAGQIMGMLDTTADLFHTGVIQNGKVLSKQYKVGTKIKARITSKLVENERRAIGVTLLEHIIALSSPSIPDHKEAGSPLQVLPLSSIIEEAKVIQLYPKIGLFLDIGVKGILGFAHISRLSDKKIDLLSSESGLYKIGSTHRARITGYNSTDGLYILSLEERILSQPFLQIEDIKVGQVVKGSVERLVINARGVGGVLINLADGITGLAPEMHMADVHLQHPERKFKQGLTVRARVLSTDVEKRLIRLTLKKTLVNTDVEPWTSYDQINLGDQAPGTLVNILPTGAVVQFFGNVRAFLPVSEMSETFIKDPTQHFRAGQVVTVRVTEVDPVHGKMVVSCRDASQSNLVLLQSLKSIPIGAIMSGAVIEKSADGAHMTLELDESGLKGILRLGHLTDHGEAKSRSTMQRIRVGQKLQELVVIEKFEKRPVVVLSNKPSLTKLAKAGNLISSFDHIQEGNQVVGFVRSITPEGVFVEFGGGLVGLLLRSHVGKDLSERPNFGLFKDSTITARVLALDHLKKQFLLTMKPIEKTNEVNLSANVMNDAVLNPVDPAITSIDDFTLGKVTKARITSVKDTQLNVKLADKIQGRVDFSEIFDNWEDIQDPKHPLKQFKNGQEVTVKILGIHDARSHRFLPITHRGKTTPLFELTAKQKSILDLDSQTLSLDKVAMGMALTAFVNNISQSCVWVNISPNVRGRISFMDLTDDVSQLNNLQENFPVGSAIRVRVKNVDVNSNRLDLSATTNPLSESLTFAEIVKGMIVAGRVTKTTERYVLVKLSPSVSGMIPLTDLSDDFSKADPTIYDKNAIVRVRVVSVDSVNKHVYLSVRQSHILSSSMPIKDRHIENLKQLKVGEIVRGFVKNVTDKGVFVALGPQVTAFVRISDLSDAYVKDWRSIVEIDRLVTGRITAVNAASSHVQISLKRSIIDNDYIPPISFDDLAVGQIVTAKVRKVEDFGVFIVVDNSNNVSGICHRSEIADEKIADARDLFEEGDIVKAVVLKVENEKHRINFGLKASYFQDDDVSKDNSDDESEDGGIGIQEEQGSEDTRHQHLDQDDIMSVGSAGNVEDAGQTLLETDENPMSTSLPGLSAGGFDWTGNQLDDDIGQVSDETDNDGKVRKNKSKKPQIQIDKTGDMDAKGPMSVADYERLLLGQPNTSNLWVQYMAFQLELGEIERARDIAERALRTINIQEQEEKLNVWIALLNLETFSGSNESIEEVFTRACQYNDAREMHEALIKIYIDSAKYSNAETLFQAMTKQKHTTIDPRFWINYATFLMTTTNEPQRARSLLQRAMKSVQTQYHRELTSKFGALEFKSPNGDPERGRTIFEGLLSTYPKRHDLWDMFISLELAKGEAANASALYERLSQQKMKGKKAKAVFKRWLNFEEQYGNSKTVEKVKARAVEYVDGLKSTADEEAG